MKRTSLALLVLGVLGSLTGYLRELAMATVFGAGRLTDVYFVAFSIPMVIGDLVIGSVLIACIIPVLSQLRDDDPDKPGFSFLNGALLLVAIFGILIASTVTAMMPILAALLAPGFDEPTLQLLAHYAHWLIWLLPINGLLLLSNLALNAYRVFVQPAISAVMVNVLSFLVIIFGYDYWGAESLIWAAMSGPILMLGLSLWRLHKEGLLRIEKPAFDSPAFRSAMELAKPVLFTFGIGSGMGLLMISHVMLRTYGSHIGEGAVSALGYAFRIYEVPISLITSTVGVLVLPVFSTLFLQGNHDKLSQIGRDLLGWGWLILLPMMLLLYALAEPLIHLLFHGGAFKENDVRQTTQALRGFAPALLFETVLMILFRMFYGIRHPEITVGIGIASLIALYAVLEVVHPATVEGLALSLSTSFAVAAVLCVSCMVYFFGKSMLPQRMEMILPLFLTGLGAGFFVLWQHSTQIGLAELALAASTFILCYTAILWKFLPERAVTVSTQIKALASGWH